MTLTERFLKDELTDEDTEIIVGLLRKTEMFNTGLADIGDLNNQTGSLHRYGGIIYPKLYDGDTARAWLDHGFGESDPKAKIRFWGIDAPEISKGSQASRKRGKKVRDHVREMIGGRGVIFVSHKVRRDQLGASKAGTGKFGRYLMEILAPDEDGKVFNVNEYLVENEMAELNTYGDKFKGWAE